ncbi:tryptophan 7-halogenase [Sphingomonas sp. A2-49]|uniref:tryptophan halogenase family protein n=1 Tax=Sphingomonas sp. A2-49 TaxID=1391375 RepID=UPI0021CECED0|nr:tryptophan halogenase family protein [Sphingomonas sp. A2-49]MCU6453761.1 tryptophan 7-halogenase [Sphingomonas sp. A2-49]
MASEATIDRVVVVGGGTAGWLAACLIAARGPAAAGRPIAVTLVESPDVPTIGVGEGTWPTMRRTLERIGIDEADFLLACDAAFKQGSRFEGWRTGAGDDGYDHPFVPPAAGDPHALVAAWRAVAADHSFADAVAAQPAVCAHGLAPRQRAMPGYAGALNYAYHLDAGKFAALLAAHGVGRLGIRHVRDHVVAVAKTADGDVAAVRTRDHGDIAGDLFLDCTGQAALLIGDTLGSGFVDRSDVLPNDRALAVQLPVAADSPIATQTIATAHAAGWLWDIGLPTRRGIGCVYASAYMDDEAALATLTGYVARVAPGVPLPPVRRLAFRSGHRERFWVRNCLAVGLSAGFLEPLEASAIVLVELSVEALLAGFPADRTAMPVHARRFDALFRYRWDRIVEFLKLHYVLSARPERYWRDHRNPARLPERLADLLAVWRHHPPSAADLPHADEVFPPASYQYVLYGMGWPAPAAPAAAEPTMVEALTQVRRRGRALAAGLPAHRDYFDALRRERPAAAHATGRS